MKKIVCFILLMIFMSASIDVYASSGQLRKAFIKTCNGVTYGQHSSDNHWHVASFKDGKYYATGNPIYSDPCSSSNGSQVESNSSSSNNDSSSSSSANNNITSQNETTIPTQEAPKSSDNTLKTIFIDGKEVEIVDNMEYFTTSESVDIRVIPNDLTASYEIEDVSLLVIGENIIPISVTAEDGTKLYGSSRHKKINLAIDFYISKSEKFEQIRQWSKW